MFVTEVRLVKETYQADYEDAHTQKIKAKPAFDLFYKLIKTPVSKTSGAHQVVMRSNIYFINKTGKSLGLPSPGWLQT